MKSPIPTTFALTFAGTLSLTMLGLVVLVACNDDSDQPDPNTITETGFLNQCEAPTDCEGTFDCVCGVCTRDCNDADDACGAGAICATIIPDANCLPIGISACMPGCVEDAGCGPGAICSGNLCIGTTFVEPDNNTVPPRITSGMECSELDCDDGDECTDDACVDLPWKIVLLVDQSSSLQCTDSQNRRLTVLNDAVSNLSVLPNVQLGFVGFSAWSRPLSFTTDHAEIATFLDPAGGLGPATDYLGALITAREMIEDDIASSPDTAPRTRYSVVVMSDGAPSPRCRAGCEDSLADCTDNEDNDGDSLIDDADPDCEGVEEVQGYENSYGICNANLEELDPPLPADQYVAFEGNCPEYNTDAQILSATRAIVDLGAQGARGVTLSTVLLFSPDEVVEAICTDAAAQLLGADREQATALLTAMATEGGGSFVDINTEDAPESVDSLSPSAVDALVECGNSPREGCGD